MVIKNEFENLEKPDSFPSFLKLTVRMIKPTSDVVINKNQIS